MTRNLIYIIFGYLSGSILYAHLFGRLLKHEDVVQNSKDQNPGTANAFMQGGFLCGVLTLLMDLFKGFLPVYLYYRGLMPKNATLMGTALVIAAPVIGHAFPVFFHWKGGKGIATSFGCMLGLFPNVIPVSTLIVFFLFYSLILRITPHFYRTICTYISSLTAMLFTPHSGPVILGFFIICAMVILRLHLSKEEREKCKVKLLWMH